MNRGQACFQENQTPRYPKLTGYFLFTCVEEVDDEGNPSDGILSEFSEVVSDKRGASTGRGRLPLRLSLFFGSQAEQTCTGPQMERSREQSKR